MELLINGLWVLSIALIIWGVLGLFGTYFTIEDFKKSFQYKIISKSQEDKIDRAEIKAYKTDIKKIIIAILIIIALLLS